MKYINDLLRAAEVVDVKFEECLSQEGNEAAMQGSSLPMINVFERANGNPLSHVCIFNDCRTKLKAICTMLMTGLKTVASGETFYFEVDKITVDNIYYFDLGPDKWLTFTDMKFNAVPI